MSDSNKIILSLSYGLYVLTFFKLFNIFFIPSGVVLGFAITGLFISIGQFCLIQNEIKIFNKIQKYISEICYRCLIPIGITISFISFQRNDELITKISDSITLLSLSITFSTVVFSQKVINKKMQNDFDHKI